MACPYNLTPHWLVGWLNNVLTDWELTRIDCWLTNWQIDWLTNWPIKQLTDCLTDLLTVWMIKWQTENWLSLTANWLTNKLTEWLGWPINWLCGWQSTDWVTDGQSSSWQAAVWVYKITLVQSHWLHCLWIVYWGKTKNYCWVWATQIGHEWYSMK